MCATCGCQESSQVIRLEHDILADNNHIAKTNRELFARHGLTVLNLLSSPGSGKTSLLVRTIAEAPDLAISVVGGDQHTDADAARIRTAGAAAVQINTGKGCHLDAAMVRHGLDHLLGHARYRDHGLLMIENVGNLVCPAAFDLGEDARVVLLSVTEGEDKPVKYPDMFRTADLVIMTKSDLLPHLDFDDAGCRGEIRRVAPSADILSLSATTGEGMEAWYDWLRARTPRDAPIRVSDVADGVQNDVPGSAG